MTEHEKIEKIRQELIQFRELLNIMSEQVHEGEQSYEALLSMCSDEDMESLRERDLQWKVAQRIIGDLSPLSKAVIHMRFNARNMERDFEQLYDIIVAPSAPDQD